jgi:PAS domain S-box-containing protein
MSLNRGERELPSVSSDAAATRVLDALEHGVIVLDRHRRPLYLNPFAHRIWPFVEKRLTPDGAATFSIELPNGRALDVRVHKGDDGTSVAEVRDVTREREAEVRERRLHDLLMEAPAMVAALRGPNHVFQFVNPVYCDVTGHRPEELIGRPAREAVPEYGHFVDYMDRVFRTGIPFTGREMPVRIERHGEPQEVYYTFVFQPSRGFGGRIEGVLLHAFEVTDQVVARQRAEAERARLFTVLENVPAGILLAEAPSGKVVLGNRRMDEILGRPVPHAAEVASYTGVVAFRPDGTRIQPEEWPLARALEGQTVTAEESLCERADGSTLWVSATAAPIRDTSGLVIGAVVVVHDIDRQKRAERALAESERQFRLITEGMPQLVWTACPDGRRDYFNQRWYEYTGTPPAHAASELWSDLLYPEDSQRTAARWQRSVTTGEDYEIEYRLRAADGTYRWFLDRAMPLHDSRGEIVRWFGTCTDIHDQKENQAALLRTNEELEQFAYAVSHDLQEPLRMLIIYSQLLKKRYEGRLDSNADLYIAYLLEGAQRLEALLSDLRSYMRVAGAAQETLFSVTSVREAIEQVLTNLEPRIVQTEAVITAGPLPLVMAERFHVEQIFQNLISNALKYRRDEPPAVHVSAQRTGHEWLFSVTDNGIGIDPQYSKHIFGVFKRLHGQKYPGTGIGLAICQKIVERYGGHIWVKSEPGRGSTFFFTLPARAQEAQ